MTLRLHTLDTGLTVATEHVPGTRSVAAGVWVAVGSRDEPDHIAGVSHFLEHLLFKGTPTRSAQDIARGVDRVGGEFDAFTAKEYTAYYCRVPARHAEFCIDLLGDVVCRPVLRDADVTAERQVILEELAMDDDSPEDVVNRRFAEALFPQHALGRDPAGDREHVRSISPADVRGFFEEHYRAGSMVVSVAGPLDHDELVRLVERSFADVATGGQHAVRTAPGAPGVGGGCADDTEQVHIAMGTRSLARGDHRREALDVVNQVIGGGMSSRLFEEVRERRGLAYAVYSTVSAFADAGAFQMYAATQADHAEEVLGLMRGELDRLVRDGITDDELEVAKGYLTGGFELGLEDTGALMARNGGLLVTTGGVRPVDEQVERWAAVDLDAVEAVIAGVLSAEPIVVTVGPIG